MNQLLLKIRKLFWVILFIQIVSCNENSVSSSKIDEPYVIKAWANTYPQMYSLECDILKKSYKAKWVKISGEEYSVVQSEAHRILCEWGMKIDINQDIDLYAGKYKYQAVPFVFDIYSSSNNSILLVYVKPQIIPIVIESNNGVKVSSIIPHPIELRIIKEGWHVLSILMGS